MRFGFDDGEVRAHNQQTLAMHDRCNPPPLCGRQPESGKSRAHKYIYENIHEGQLWNLYSFAYLFVCLCGNYFCLLKTTLEACSANIFEPESPRLCAGCFEMTRRLHKPTLHIDHRNHIISESGSRCRGAMDFFHLTEAHWNNCLNT